MKIFSTFNELIIRQGGLKHASITLKRQYAELQVLRVNLKGPYRALLTLHILVFSFGCILLSTNATAREHSIRKGSYVTADYVQTEIKK